MSALAAFFMVLHAVARRRWRPAASLAQELERVRRLWREGE